MNIFRTFTMSGILPREIIEQLCQNSIITRAIRCTRREFRTMTAAANWPLALAYVESGGVRTVTDGYVAARSVLCNDLFGPWDIIVDGVTTRYWSYFAVMKRYALELVLMGKGDILIPRGYEKTWVGSKPRRQHGSDLYITRCFDTAIVETVYELAETLEKIKATQCNHGYRTIFVFHIEAHKLVYGAAPNV